MPDILFVDEEERRLAPFLKALTRAGHNVFLATRAADAVQQAKKYKEDIDLIVMDLMLPTGIKEPHDVEPRRAGIWALQQIRQIDELRKTPVLVLSAISQRTVKEETDKLGVLAYIEKPTTRADFLKAVNAALGLAEDGT